MKLSTLVLQLAVALGALPLNSAGGGGGGSSSCCKFTLSSEGPLVYPAGQLGDGQIRLNGTYATSTFCISPDGGFADEKGFGCIVTEPPITQIQCDQGKAPAGGFSIGQGNAFLYNGSPNFFACPATDTEWNIYMSPKFGQAKCTPIMLKTDGCGAESPSCPPLPSPAVTVTSWHTRWQTQTSTITETEPCPTTGWNSTRRCSKCTRTPTATNPGGTGGAGCTKPSCTSGGHGTGSGGATFTIMQTSSEISPPITTRFTSGGKRGMRWLRW